MTKPNEAAALHASDSEHRQEWPGDPVDEPQKRAEREKAEQELEMKRRAEQAEARQQADAKAAAANKNKEG